MVLDEVKVTRAIAESYLESFLGVTDVDVALVGAGPPISSQPNGLRRLMSRQFSSRRGSP